MPRMKVIAGNWKMNKTNPEAVELATALADRVGHLKEPRIVICPPFTALSPVAETLRQTMIHLGAQNMHKEKSGAYTGEIGPSMLLTTGVSYVILGHSERREYFSESDELVNAKVSLALESGLMPVVCVGEQLEDREKGLTEEIVGGQIDGSLAGLSEKDLDKMVVAYEPVWAIGTGKTATPEMAGEVHAFIRSRLKKSFGAAAEDIPILYGGSVKGGNAADLLSQPDIDGALVGGASLEADEFIRIIEAA